MYVNFTMGWTLIRNFDPIRLHVMRLVAILATEFIPFVQGGSHGNVFGKFVIGLNLNVTELLRKQSSELFPASANKKSIYVACRRSQR